MIRMVFSGEKLSLKARFFKNAFHCVCLLGDCWKSALNANDSDSGSLVRRVLNVA
jgi:hypothetical protein